MKISVMICKVIGLGLLGLLPISVPAQSLKVILLGTGNPEPLMERFSAGILVEAGARKLLFDGGRGGMIRLAQMKIRAADVNPLFLTHLHSDHVVGIPDLLLTGWLRGRENPLQVFGPEGTTEMMRHLEQAYQADIRFRSSPTRSTRGVTVLARDIKEGVVYEEGGVKVTAFHVRHTREAAFGYRVDYAGRSVVLSGDTDPTDNLVRFAEGVDLLIHEVSLPGTGPGQGGAGHTTPEDAGKIFTRVKPRLAVYSHIIPSDAPAEDFIVGTRKTYNGPLEVGEDLMSIEVGNEIRVSRFPQ